MDNRSRHHAAHQISFCSARAELPCRASMLSLLAAIVLMAAGSTPAFADSSAALSTLHVFTGSATDGASARAGLVQGGDGDFYGTTQGGGSAGDGIVYKVSTDGALTVLHSFEGADGSTPSAGLVLGGDGNFYGTTSTGGSNGYGVVFRMTPAGALTVLYSFGGTASDGVSPKSGLVQGADGAFYGTTTSGGSANDGTVFKITSEGALTILRSFGGSDGANPAGALVQGGDGNLYGTTEFGGTKGGYGYGTVFKMTPAGELTVLYSFSPDDGNGVYPCAGLAAGTDGNFYGTASAGGSSDDGTIFKITPAGVFSVLHDFDGSDGAFPNASLLQGSDGNFYGTTSALGAGGNGTIFRSSAGGAFALVYAFSGTDGGSPYAGLAQTSGGSFLGTTSLGGGDSNGGTVFSLAVPGLIVAATPAGLTAAPGNAAVTLSWSAAAGAASYSVYESTTAGGEGTTPVKTSITGTSITLVGLANGTTYYFKVAGVNGAGVSPPSAEVSALPLAPPGQVTGLRAIPGNGQALLSWSAPPGASSHIVYLGFSPGGESPLTTGVAATSYTVTGLANGTRYYFQIAAANTSGTGARSTEVSITPLAGTAAAPSFSPSGGTYSTAQTVTINDATPGVTIHYTTDGSTPTAVSTPYTGALVVSSSQTVKAIAIASAYADSGVASASYTLSAAAAPTDSATSGGSGGGGATAPALLLMLAAAAGLRRKRSRVSLAPVNRP